MSTQELRSGVEHRSGGLRSGAAWRIRASEQRTVQRSIGALERRVAQRSGMEHRSGRAAALDGVEHRSGGLRSGEERSIGAEGCAAERSGASEDRSRVLPRTEWSIGAEGCAAERSGASEHRSGRDGVEQIRGRIGASECRISAVERSGAEWSKQN